MAYKIWAVIPPQGESPSPLPAEAFFIKDTYTDTEAAQEWLENSGFEGYVIDKEVSEITGDGGPVRPTSSGGRPVL